MENFQGFGVAITGSSCYNLKQMQEQERTAFLQSVYGKGGLNLSVGRLTMGASDYSAEIYTYADEPFDTELKHFSIERDKEYIIPMIQEILKIRPDLYLFASPWSPPAWMKTGGNICGGYMRDEYLECYAEYFVRYVEAYKREGIEIKAVTPQNETECQNRGYPTCIWHPDTEAKFVKMLKDRFLQRGLDVKIWFYDHCFHGVDRVLWSLKQDQELVQKTDGVAFHYYEGEVEQTKILAQAFPNLELHFTEGGPRLYDHYDSDWCKWSIMIARALKTGYRSFTGWNLLLNETGGPNVGPWFCGGLVTANRVTGNLDYSGQYKAFSHIAPYLKKNAKIYALSESEEHGNGGMFGYPHSQKKKVQGLAIVNPDGKTVLVLINPNEDKAQTQVCWKGENWYVELLSDSVSTIIF
ncbi:MAG: hypothetical protein IIX01_04890 [Clostridia bacterium]|nr:hypothetical protein [Clostridia bacterium]